MSHEYLILEPDGELKSIALDQDFLSALAVLPEDPALYFDLDQPHQYIPLGSLVNVWAREKGIVNANLLMQEAANGNQEKRKPLTVRAMTDQLWLVVDGNSTLINARFS